MKKLKILFLNNFPIVAIVLAVVIFFYQFFLFGKIPLPADTIVGLYHPFRDVVADTFPNGIPVKNSLITDPVRQQYVWRWLSVEQLKKMQLPLWNPYSFSGTPLLANFQSASFYPLNIIFFITDFIWGWTMLIILQPLLSGIFLYWYLRYFKLKRAACLIGALTYAFSGFHMVWQQWNTIAHVGIWLPLILLAKEHLIQKISYRWVFIFLFAEIAQILAGHLQVLFYSLCITNIYLFVRIYQHIKKQNILLNFIKKYIPFLVAATAVFVFTSVQLIPTAQFIMLSARNVDQANYLRLGWFIPWQNLIQFIVPDYFGNPATGNYWGIWNYAEFVGYIGVLPLIFSFYALFYRRDMKTLFFGSFAFLSLLFALATPIGYIPFKLNIPFLSSSQPTRLIFVADFALSILAAFGYEYFSNDKKKKRISIIILLFVLSLLVLWSFPIINNLFNLSVPMESIQISQRNLFLPTLFLAISVLLITFYIFGKNRYKIFIEFIFIVFVIFDLFRFGWKFLPFSNKELIFPISRTIQQLKDIENFDRIMAIDRRILPPNFSVYYNLYDVSGYDPLYLKSYNQFVASWERGRPDISPAAFNRIVTPQKHESFLTDLMGIRYILSFGPLQSEKLKLIASEGNTYVYQNTKSFPRVYLAKKVLYVSTKQEEMDTIYNLNENLLQTAITREKVDLEDKPLAGNENSQILHYEENSIRIYTETETSRLMVLTDIYYPSWKVYIDGKKGDILPVNFIFRGVIVPNGKHIIEFRNQLI